VAECLPTILDTMKKSIICLLATIPTKVPSACYLLRKQQQDLIIITIGCKETESEMHLPCQPFVAAKEIMTTEIKVGIQNWLRKQMFSSFWHIT
jgi:hypothetical protein